MFRRICITNRHLAMDLPVQIRRAIESGADTVILREKDMAEEEYQELAESVDEVCKEMGAELILHTFKDAAQRLGIRRIHLTMGDFLKLEDHERESFETIGVSTHSTDEALLAERMGASYITASPIFETDCKPGARPAGLGYLREVAGAVNIPVYALGGISEDNMSACVAAGASGACMMSGYMKQEMIK